MEKRGGNNGRAGVGGKETWKEGRRKGGEEVKGQNVEKRMDWKRKEGGR